MTVIFHNNTKHTNVTNGTTCTLICLCLLNIIITDYNQFILLKINDKINMFEVFEVKLKS